jgi:hypothetical protein
LNTSVRFGRKEIAVTHRLGMRTYRAFMVSLYLAASLWILIMWATDVRPFIGLNLFERARFLDLIYGRAHRPFVYRALVPWLIRGTLAVVPGALTRGLSEALPEALPIVGRAADFLSWEREHLPEYAIALGLAYLAIIGYLVALRWLGRQCYDMPASERPWLTDTLPLLSLVVLPVFFKRGTHFLYDLPALFLFTLALACLRAHRVRAYYAVYAIGLLNKETMLLAGVAMALWVAAGGGHRWRERLMWHAGVHIALFAIVRLALIAIYRHNPGEPAELRLLDNLIFYSYPYWFTAVTSVGSVVLLIGHDWKKKPLLLRSTLWLVVPFFGLYLVAGSWGEIRVFYELLPVCYLLGFQTVAKIMGWPMNASVEYGEAVPLASS